MVVPLFASPWPAPKSATGDILLRVWHRGIHQYAGDVVLYWISTLHFGNFGGVWVKALWVVLGLAPAVLFISGSLM